MRFIYYLVESEESVERWNDYLRSESMLRNAVGILKDIEKKGFKAYIVGGCVRDIILGKKPKDIDIAGNMPLDDIKKYFNTYSLSGDEFGIIGIKYSGYTFEYAMFRGESYMKVKGVRKIQK
ncbi:MAG: hypothetical protein ACOC5T_05160 [Elusimicrobiota bacterium]